MTAPTTMTAKAPLTEEFRDAWCAGFLAALALKNEDWEMYDGLLDEYFARVRPNAETIAV